MQQVVILTVYSVNIIIHESMHHLKGVFVPALSYVDCPHDLHDHSGYQWISGS